VNTELRKKGKKGGEGKKNKGTRYRVWKNGTHVSLKRNLGGPNPTRYCERSCRGETAKRKKTGSKERKKRKNEKVWFAPGKDL